MSECEKSDLIVETLNGRIKGKLLTTVFGKDVKVFHKVPYAQPPVGALRFKDPLPVENWCDTLDCTIESSPNLCYNPYMNELQGDEDALFLNAYTKNTEPKKLASVMVWIHGGGFILGSASSDFHSPDYLMEKDIVFFSFNYRLGPFGFLSFDDPDLKVPGNAGLKDQTMALRWIKDNAEAFGGDPNNITIFGISAGGASVHYHMISDLSKDLFHKAISMSGVANNEWAMQYTAKNLTLALAKQLGWNENDGTSKALEILQSTDGTDILHMVDSLIPAEEKKNGLQFTFVPSVEPYIAEQCFLAKSPIDAMQNAWGDKIPLIIGAVSEEGSAFYVFHKDQIDSEDACDGFGDFQSAVDIHRKLGKDSDKIKMAGAALKEIYYKTEKKSKTDYINYGKLMGDRYFLRGINKVVECRVNNSNSTAPTYYYRFDFDDKFADGLKKLYGVAEIGVSHGSDMCYIFKMSKNFINQELQPGSPAFLTVQRLVGLFTSFAATGNPNCPEIEPVQWEPVDTKTPPYKVLNISNDLSFIDLPDTERLVALDNVYEELIK